MQDYSAKLQKQLQLFLRMDCIINWVDISQAPMTTPTKQELIAQNLYEIPSCTICLQQLHDDLSSLNCGHIFHLGCISQHFQYRGTCPNCQKRANLKQIRTIHYPVTQNSKATTHLRSLLSNLDTSERKQLQKLFQEIKTESENNQKLKYQIGENQKHLKSQKTQIDTMKEELTKKREDLESLRRENLQLQRCKKALSEQLVDRQKSQTRLRIEVEKAQKQEKQLQQMKKLKKMMNQNSQQLMKYKSQLQLQKTPPEQMARLFSDMLMIKNLQLLKTKDKLNEFPEKLYERQQEVNKLKQTVQNVRKEMRELNDKKNQERKRYEQLKVKYRSLMDKAKAKGIRENQIPDMEDSQGFSNVIRNPHVPLEPVIQTALTKRPSMSINFGSTIGGFKKKDDGKLRFFK